MKYHDLNRQGKVYSGRQTEQTEETYFYLESKLKTLIQLGQFLANSKSPNRKMETKMIVAQNKNKNLAPIKKMEMKATVAKS